MHNGLIFRATFIKKHRDVKPLQKKAVRNKINVEY